MHVLYNSSLGHITRVVHILYSIVIRLNLELKTLPELVLVSRSQVLQLASDSEFDGSNPSTAGIG